MIAYSWRAYCQILSGMDNTTWLFHGHVRASTNESPT